MFELLYVIYTVAVESAAFLTRTSIAFIALLKMI